MNNNKQLRALCEAAIMVAASMVLSYIKIPIGLSFGGFGGSIDFVMIPLILLACRWGCLWGLGAGLVFGTLKFFFAGGTAVDWQSMLLDYSVAYMFVGFAGLIRKNLALGALVGCVGRFIIHYISGVTIYAMYMPEEFFGMTMTSPAFYSLLYNGSYMLPNTILAIVVCALLIKPLKRFYSSPESAS